MSTFNTKSAILLPLAGSSEFNNLPNGYFWLKNIIMNSGMIVEPIAFDARNKEQIVAILENDVKCMEMGTPTSIISCRLQDFRLLLHAIKKQVDWTVPFEIVQRLKKRGVFTLPEDLYYVANIPRSTN